MTSNLDSQEDPQAATPPKDTPRRLKPWPAVVLLATSTLLAVFAAELMLRVFAPQHPSWMAIYRNHPELNTYTLEPNVDTLVDTGEGRYSVYTDENGYRVAGDSNSTGNDDALLLVLGDSYAFGQGVAYEESMVGYLEAAPQLPLRPLNAAVGGYGPQQYRMVLEHLLKDGLKPTFVLVVVYTGNDFHDCLWNKERRVADGIINNPRTLRAWVKRSSHLYRMLAKAYHLYWPGSHDSFNHVSRELADPKSWESGRLSQARKLFADELRKIDALCEERSVPWGVVLIPPEQAVASARGETTELAHDVPNADSRLPIENAVAICREIGAQHLDLTPVLAKYPTEKCYFRFDGHFRPLANRLASLAVLETFDELQGEPMVQNE